MRNCGLKFILCVQHNTLTTEALNTVTLPYHTVITLHRYSAVKIPLLSSDNYNMIWSLNYTHIPFNGHFQYKKKDICVAPHSKKLAAEALRCRSHSFHTANTPHLPLPIAFHQSAPLLCVVIASI